MTNTTHLKSNHTSSQNNWIFSQQDVELHTPSRQDGISYQQELYQRAFGVDLIVRVSAVRVDVWVAFGFAIYAILFHVADPGVI